MRRVRSMGALAASAVLATVIAGCGSTSAPQGQPASQPAMSAPSSMAPTSMSPSAPAAAVPDQLRFTGRTLDGAPFGGEQLAGKAAVLWFWAPWCPNCRAEAPTVGRTAVEHANTVSFVGVASRDTLAAMRDFVGRYQVGGFPHLADESGELWRRFGVTYQPAYAFVTRTGAVEVVKRKLSEQELRERVRGLAG